jgi:hypothetical protein
LKQFLNVLFILTLHNGGTVLVHLNKKFMANRNSVSDLPDSEKDKAKLQPDEATLDLPDVKDIPGQEFVHPPNLREMADTTISSDDGKVLDYLMKMQTMKGNGYHRGKY